MGPEIATSYEAFLFADDDDGDLSNGTPNQCLLIEAFGDHGLGPKGQTGFYQLEHTPISNQSTSDSIDIDVQVEQILVIVSKPKLQIQRFTIAQIKEFLGKSKIFPIQHLVLSLANSLNLKILHMYNIMSN